MSQGSRRRTGLQPVIATAVLIVLAVLSMRPRSGAAQAVDGIDALRVREITRMDLRPRESQSRSAKSKIGTPAQSDVILIEDFESSNFPPPGWEVYDVQSLSSGVDARHTWSRQHCQTHPVSNGSAVAWSAGGGTFGQKLRCGQDIGEPVNARLAHTGIDTRPYPGGIEVSFDLWLDLPIGNDRFNVCWRDVADNTAYCYAFAIVDVQLRKRWLVLNTPLAIPEAGGKAAIEFMFWFMDIDGTGDYEGVYIDNVAIHGRRNVNPDPSTPFPTDAVLPPTPYTSDGMPMRYVPAGAFTRGSSASDPQATPDEMPQHQVQLDAFWIDGLEVTNAMFERFIEQTDYATIADQAGYSYGFDAQGDWIPIRDANWRHPLGPESNIFGKDEHPVVAIGWRDAMAYCGWMGRRLPTEAEWEKAARGSDARRFPWGDEPVTGNRANVADIWNPQLPWHDPSIDDGFHNTAPGDRYPMGASAFGALNMAGNVAEWVLDNYRADLYSQTIGARNPVYRSSSGTHVLRGGNYNDDPAHVRSARRYADDSFHSAIDMGFRCASSDRLAEAYLPLVLRQRPALTATPLPTQTPKVEPPTSTPAPDPCRPVPELEGKHGQLDIVGPPSSRPAAEHPEYNLALRSYVQVNEERNLVHYDGHVDPSAPQLFDMLGRVPRFSSTWRVNQWLYDESPERRGKPEESFPVSLLGFETQPDELVRVPHSGYDIGRGYRVLVLYASEDRITLKYTGEDSVVEGYTIHIENVCVAPALLDEYRRHDRAGRGSLPAVLGKAPIGRPRGPEILVSVRDTGRWMDPRSQKDWWIRTSLDWWRLDVLDRSWIVHDTGVMR